ncbi:MAG: glycosyltransferase [Ignavibacteriales bacterium]|nr:glycosyltransferase [Ignavibacteriales bacterium]
MKIAAILMQYDYGIRERGFSYEYINILLPLKDVFGEGNVVHFDFYNEFRNSGKEMMNKNLKAFIQNENPDVALFCLYEDEFDPAVLDELKEITRTVVYFFDDPWRQSFVKKWIKHFTSFSTPDYYMFNKYKLEGVQNVFFTPFGFNVNIYKKTETDKKYEVSFVGGYGPLRKWIFTELERQGIKVNVFGRGWGSEAKWLSHDEMVLIFNQSKINLNLSNATDNDFRFLSWSLKSPKALKQLILLKKNKEQIKGRHYEINACGGFQLSYFVPGLNLAYEIDKEIAVYENLISLPKIIKYFLEDNELREKIAFAGYERSLKNHTAQNYLKVLVDKVMFGNL